MEFQVTLCFLLLFFIFNGHSLGQSLLPKAQNTITDFAKCVTDLWYPAQMSLSLALFMILAFFSSFFFGIGITFNQLRKSAGFEER